MNSGSEQTQRLQKFIARCGVASRRHAEELIRSGKVRVNGQIVREMGVKVTTDDIIEVNGKIITPQEIDAYKYLLLNKPEGVITSVSDPRGRQTVIDLIKNVKERIYPVGRLDYDTSGLLLLTNHGELTYRLTHPSFGINKVYRVWTEKYIPQGILDDLARGIVLEDGKTAPAKLKRITQQKKGKNLYIVEITIHEGRNRQIRRMFEKVGYPVVKLQRIAFGPLKLDNLGIGEYRFLKKNEVEALKKQVGLI